MHHNKPFAASSPDDHRASVWVASFLCLTFVALGVGTRTWIRIRVFGIDDYVVLAAFVVALAQFCTVFGGLSTGLGKATDELSSKKAELAGQVFNALLPQCISTSSENCDCRYSSLRRRSSSSPSTPSRMPSCLRSSGCSR